MKMECAAKLVLYDPIRTRKDPHIIEIESESRGRMMSKELQKSPSIGAF
jgi:hypothetical protein